MYITYHCNKFKIIVLCRFHIEQQMLIIHIFSTNLHRITLLRFQVNLQKAENTLTVRHWQFPYISAFDIFISQILCTLTILKVPIFCFSQFCSDFSYLPPDQIRYILCRLTFPHAAAVQISWGSAWPEAWSHFHALFPLHWSVPSEFPLQETPSATHSDW